MGYSTRSVPIFTDNITLDVHTATYVEHLLSEISLAYFADGQPLALDQVCETGEYIATRKDGAFIQGMEI
jgi:hypothetical protein